MLLLLLNYVVLRTLWKIDVYLISTLVNKSLYYKCVLTQRYTQSQVVACLCVSYPMWCVIIVCPCDYAIVCKHVTRCKIQLIPLETAYHHYPWSMSTFCHTLLYKTISYTGLSGLFV